jgi:hypothetical protein
MSILSLWCRRVHSRFLGRQGVRRPLFGVACAVGIAIGCGRVPLDQPPEAADAAAGGNASVFSTPTAFCREFEAHIAGAESRCFGGPPADALAAWIAATCDPLDGLVASGRIGYDATAAAACLSRFDATYATSCLFATYFCTKAVVGHVPDGALCTSAAECGPSSSCERPDQSQCGAKVCTPPRALGAPCGAECADGLVCATDGSNVCVPDTGRVGDPCLDTSSCDWGLFCSVDASTTRGICREATTGMACQADGDCRIEDFCDGTCQPRLRVGASCALNRQACVAFAMCDPATDRCITAGGSGQPCGENGTCFVGACTNALSSDGICLSGQPPGSPCTDPAECATGVCNVSCQSCAR